MKFHIFGKFVFHMEKSNDKERKNRDDEDIFTCLKCRIFCVLIFIKKKHL